MSASSWTESPEPISSSLPSSARAASPCLLSMSSAIRLSMVWAARIRHAVTGSSWPIRWTRSIACCCSAAVQESSARTTFDAACRLRPTPAASREHSDRDLRVLLERVDSLLALVAGLVASNRDGPQLRLLEDPLGGVHDVDVLGEEHDLADRPGQLRGVVRRQRGLGLADPAHHGEDVLALLATGARGLELLQAYPSHEVLVDLHGRRGRDREHAALPVALLRLADGE